MSDRTLSNAATQSYRDQFRGRRLRVAGVLGFTGSSFSRVLVQLGDAVRIIDACVRCGVRR